MKNAITRWGEVASVAACFIRYIKSEVAIKARLIFPLFSFFKKAGGKAFFNKSRRRKRRIRMTDLIYLRPLDLASAPQKTKEKQRATSG